MGPVPRRCGNRFAPRLTARRNGLMGHNCRIWASPSKTLVSGEIAPTSYIIHSEIMTIGSPGI